MRQDAAGTLIARRLRDPRIVIGIIYASGSIYLTNRQGIANVPGSVVHGCVTDISTTSQTLSPDERRTTIGTLSFRAVDLGGAITTDVRDQLLTNARGVRRREVRVFTGDVDDFNQFSRVETYVVDGVKLNRLTYEFSCSDRSLEQRVAIFDQAKTHLTSTISATDTTITVVDTADFQTLAHTASFSDAPSSTVGYFTIGQTGEVVRYTGKTGTTFTGCTRGVFGTLAQALEVTATVADKKPEIVEYIYLEMPGPQLDYAVKTGKIKGTANVMPDAWHMGIDEANIAGDQYDAVGADLYDPASATAGLVLRFDNLTKTDGKRFCESELYVPMGTYAPINSMGVIGIRRLAALVPDAAAVAQLDPTNVISHGDLTHALSKVINQVVVNWNFSGDRFTRSNVFYNATSIGDGDTGHGATPPLELDLHGVNVASHTSSTLRRVANYFFERYGAPPQELSVKASRSMNHLEIGDVVRVALPGVRDFAGTSTLGRSFEIQSRRINWATGELQLQLFGSTQRTPPDAGGGTGAVLADAYYNGGTALSSVLTIASNHVTANGSLTGGSDLRAAVFHHTGDLTIDAGKTVTITGNVLLLIKGTLTVNGKIDGKGGGLAAISDPNTVASAFQFSSAAPFRQTLGSTRGSGGIRYIDPGVWWAQYGQGLSGMPSMPLLALAVDASGNLTGLPADIRGTPGFYGWPVVEGAGVMTDTTVRSKGGAGGASGAGLAIVSRGTLAFGVSGQIDLSGNNGAAPASPVTLHGHSMYAGAGAGGAPGALYWIGDGDDIVDPDLSTALIVNQGSTPQAGTTKITLVPGIDGFPAEPWTGFDVGTVAADLYSAAAVIQHVPSGKAGAADDDVVPAPTTLAAVGTDIGVTVTWGSPPADKHDVVEVWRATSNDRTGSVLVFRGRANAYFESSASVITRYFWVRARKAALGVSAWDPLGSTSGVSATYGGANGLSAWTPVLVNVTRNGAAFTKTGGANSTWDAAFSSQESYPACLVEGTVVVASDTTMVGLNSDPTTDANYTSIDHAIYAHGGGPDYRIYESGAEKAVVGGSPTAGDRMSIAYDGQVVRYYVNGVLLYSTPRFGAKLYADSSFFNTGASLAGVTFSPFGAQNAVLDEVRDDFIYANTTDFFRKWLDRAGSGEITFVTGQGDTPAGTAVLIGNNSGNDMRWLALTQLMPYDGISPYEIEVYVYRLAAGGLFYCGLEGVASDGVTLIDTTGANSSSTQHYIAASGATLAAGWNRFRGYVRGWSTSAGGQANDSSAPAKMYTGVTFIRPLFICHHPSNTGQSEVAFIAVRRLGGALNAKDTVNTPEIDANATEESGSVFDAGPISHSTVA